MPDNRGAVNLSSNYPLDKANHGSPELHKIGVSLLDPTYVAPLITNPAEGTGSVGTSDEVARADHVHPLQFGMQFTAAYASAEPFTLTTSNAVVTGTTSATFVLARNSFFQINMTADAEGSVVGYGIAVITLEMNTNGGGWVAFGQSAIMGTLAGLRLTVAQSYGGFLAPASYQFRMIAAKSAAGGTAVLHATHTGYSGYLLG